MYAPGIVDLAIEYSGRHGVGRLTQLKPFEKKPANDEKERRFISLMEKLTADTLMDDGGSFSAIDPSLNRLVNEFVLKPITNGAQYHKINGSDESKYWKNVFQNMQGPGGEDES